MATAAPQSVDERIAICATEPIHIPGGIQPHGFLFCVEENGVIVQASENAAELTGGTFETILGASLREVLGESPAAAIAAALGQLREEGVPLYAGSMEHPRSEALAHAAPLAIVVHRFDGVALIELEPARGTDDVFFSMYPLVRTFVGNLQKAQGVIELAELAAQEVQRITGYGRTLVHRFDEEGNGAVLAQALLPGYHSYLGRHFPASDIPAPARALYVRNRLRVIADAGYTPARLIPAIHPRTGKPTDLTYASLRGVSPLHTQSMKDMGMWSSMSMSIVVRGKLWGLISCHHATPRVPSFEVRTACEHIAQVLSLQVEAKEDQQEAERRLALRTRLSALLAAMANSVNFVDALAQDPSALLGLMRASGAAIVFDGHTVTIGTTPRAETVNDLVTWLDGKSEDVFATDSLAAAWGKPVDPDNAGILVLSFSKLFRNYIIWFRAERARTIEGAGESRESFDAWTGTVRGRSPGWLTAELEIAVEFRTALLGIVLRRAEELAQLATQLGRANQELEGFSYTVSHDLRAPLRHIVGFADLLYQLDGDRLSERGKHFVERVISAARFGGRLVDDLLAFSRTGRSALHPERFELRSLVDAVIAEESKDAADRSIEWKIGELRAVVADPVLTKVVLQNLIGNALKFTRESEPGKPREHTLIEIGYKPGDGVLADQDVFYVRDNGIGFDMRYVDKLFGVFQRLHRYEEFEGTGIGLATVRRIVERHGGRAWAVGEVGRGATIYFSLPREFKPQVVEDHETASDAVARLAALSQGQPFRPVLKDSKFEDNKRVKTDPAR
ncbi:ATP-binding protein [Trinickia diaoshuihuensis]|jgi:light-regulated signal transduction histidine kinase (bacteriophytochrome)|uniref:ATP-binding protein n=1 Tax=Trinickia diaoshuihuensis TaxID=2292265 RepID=UPI000E2320CF|nr:ATP-binding protein [Trinickia diaoshuihuensis]